MDTLLGHGMAKRGAEMPESKRGRKPQSDHPPGDPQEALGVVQGPNRAGGAAGRDCHRGSAPARRDPGGHVL
jgi:hypothetical protein